MRIIFIRPCCIGDVVMATAALSAVRAAYPDAHITWAVGGWSRAAIQDHPALDAVLDTGQAALPVRSLMGMVQFVRALRAGNYDLMISLVRSPLMSLAALLSGIPQRIGMDSNGRGFGYTHKLPVNPQAVIHEARLYLDVVALLGIDTEGYEPSVPVTTKARNEIIHYLQTRDINAPYIILNPNGGDNPGMQMHSKRYPLPQLAQVGDALAQAYHAHLILIGAHQDRPTVMGLAGALQQAHSTFIGELSFPQLAALAADALLYLGNDTGLTHLAAAAGARTAMILGPSDPRRYAPYHADSLVLWREATIQAGGVAQASDHTWEWARDGITPEAIISQVQAYLQHDA